VPSHGTHEQPKTTHDSGAAEPLLGMQPAAVDLIYESTDTGNDQRKAERPSAED
jgi:hypothetical protein